MTMMRFFNEYTAFGTESTATKILYGIKDIHFSSHTDAIHNLTPMVTLLGRVIASAMDYPRYQQLDAATKDKVRNCLINKLSAVGLNYKSENANYVRAPDLPFVHGFQLKQYYEKNGDYYQGQIAIHFPETLFLKQSELARHVQTALQADHPGLLKSNDLRNKCSDYEGNRPSR